MCCRSLAFVVLFGFAISPTIGRSAEKNPSELELTTERAIVFKDGHSLILKRGVATTDAAGEVYTDDVPDAAVLGSFWAFPEEGRLVSMLAGWTSAKNSDEKELRCTQPIEILYANRGKQARIQLNDKTTYSGVIQDVLVEKTTVAMTAPQLEMLDLLPAAAPMKPAAAFVSRSSRTTVESSSEYLLSAINGANFILRTEEGDALLPVNQVRTITVKDMKSTINKTLTTAKQTKRLRFKFADKNKKQGLTILYFRPGVRWIPTYRIALSDQPKKMSADISLQAEFLNEAEDLDDVPVDIVVGVPNFRFQGTPSPLVLEATLRNALAEAAPAIMGNNRFSNSQMSNAMFSQRSGEMQRPGFGSEPAAEPSVNLPSELTAGGTQDLFVYNLPKLTLGKGDRMAVPILTTETSYRDIYTWDVRLTKHDNAAAPSGAGVKSPLVLATNEVWHQVVLKNDTKFPWTTGAAMFMQGNQPLAQELLTYTPPRSEVRVPVTVAVDVRGTLSEKETGRALSILQWDGYNYARIDKEVSLELRNSKGVEIDVEITLRLGGKVTTASDDGSVVLGPYNAADWIDYHGSPAVNNSSTVTWRTKLAPGAKFEPTVNYHHFTRH